MTRATRIKLSIAIGAVAFLGLAAITAGGICYLIMRQTGTDLAAQGYTAEMRGEHDIAIERLTRALPVLKTAIAITPALTPAFEARADVYRPKEKKERARLDVAEAAHLRANRTQTASRAPLAANKSSTKTTLDVAPLPHLDATAI